MELKPSLLFPALLNMHTGLMLHGRNSILNCGKDILLARCSWGSRVLVPWRGQRGRICFGDI